MIEGTTPTFTLRVKSNTLDFHDVKNIYFTIKQGNTIYTKTGENIVILDNNIVATTLTQQETLSFRPKVKAEIQLNWTYNDGRRAATRAKEIDISKNLIKEVLD